MRILVILFAAVFSGSVIAKSLPGDFLVQVAADQKVATAISLMSRLPAGTTVQDLGVNGWMRVKMPASEAFAMQALLHMPGVMNAEPNMVFTLGQTWKVDDPSKLAILKEKILAGEPGIPGDAPQTDNPDIPTSGSGGAGSDPLYSSQWGMNQMGVHNAWSVTKGLASVVVAVIDTGVDYTHEDLNDNIWRNPGEAGDKAANGIDDDGNGYVDDVIGWDFADKDNKPYDFTGTLMEILFSGKNPGHGTHCAGNVAARSDNGKGIAGVAPGVRIMPLRFITRDGQGTTADAVLAIKYAADNGALITSNSWGSEGDDGGAEPQSLKDAITYAEQKGLLFIAAAGNGRQGVGYNNDTDPKPSVPASYTHASIISVAAINDAGAFGAFSNFGQMTVDLGAPGVKVFSTVTQPVNYTDTIIDMFGITATWDGTSMATPHVAGAAALYWSAHPEKTAQQVKAAILGSVKSNPNMQGKTVTGGQLDVQALMTR